IINGSRIECGLPILSAKLTTDTKGDLVKFKGLSKSQKNLAALLHCVADKVDMTQSDWREANRLTKRGLALTKKRVIGDVLQNIELREKLIKHQLLGPPRWWRSEGQMRGRYTP